MSIRKKRVKKSAIWALMMVIVHYLGKYSYSGLFGFGIGSLILLFVSFGILMWKELTQLPDNIFQRFSKCMKTVGLSLIVFLFVGLALSSVFNNEQKFTPLGIMYELPNVIASVIVYGIWATVFSVFIAFISLIKTKRKSDPNVLDDGYMDDL